VSPNDTDFCNVIVGSPGQLFLVFPDLPAATNYIEPPGGVKIEVGDINDYELKTCDRLIAFQNAPSAPRQTKNVF
jgi:hypothetical protein